MNGGYRYQTTRSDPQECPDCGNVLLIVTNYGDMRQFCSPCNKVHGLLPARAQTQQHRKTA